MHTSAPDQPPLGVCTVDSRAIRLERAGPHGEVGLGDLGLKGTSARLEHGVLSGGLVDEVADPGVPSRLDLAGVVVVLGVLNPARAQGELLVVLEELVAGAVGADEGSCFGVACVVGGRVSWGSGGGSGGS